MRTIDGIWAAQIYGVYGWESEGVLFLENGRVLGGGNNHYSVGSYTQSEDQLSMVLSVEYHGHVRTRFGESREKISVKFNGKQDGMEITGTLERPDRAAMTIACRLSKCAELPD